MNVYSCTLVSSTEKRLIVHQDNTMFAKDENLCQGKKTLSAQFQEEGSKFRDPVRGIESTSSGTDESLFGNFIKSRQENAAFQEMLVDELSSSVGAKNVERAGGKKSLPEPLMLGSKSPHRQSTSSKLARDHNTEKAASKKAAYHDYGMTAPTLSTTGMRPRPRKQDSFSKDVPPHAPVSSPNKLGTGSKRSTTETGLGIEGSCHSLNNSPRIRSPRISKKSALDLKSPSSSPSKQSSPHQSRLLRSPKIRSPPGIQGKSPKVTTATIRQEMNQALKNFPDLHMGDSSNHRTSRSSPSLKPRKVVADEQKRGPQLDIAEDILPVVLRSSLKSTKEEGLDTYQVGPKRSPVSTANCYGEDTRSIVIDSMPPLVDDTLQRDNLEGIRGGTQWSILEDSPGGHAPEKLAVVSAVEYVSDDDHDDVDEEEHGCKDGHDESADEDDDIFDEDIYMPYDDSQHERLDWRKSLPRDPANNQALTSLHQSPTIRPVDRFNPGFCNIHMWSTNVDLTSPLDRSGVFSLSSDQGEDLDTVSELVASVHEEQTSTNHVTDISSSGRADKSGSANRTKTPATTKRNGGRHSDGSPVVMPILDQGGRKIIDTREVAAKKENRLLNPVAVGEDALLNERNLKRGRKGATPAEITTQQSNPKSGSSSSGRSSRRKDVVAGHVPRPPTTTRYRRNSIPEVVRGVACAELSPIGRSPLSSSMTSTPNSLSIASSGQQGAAMHTLRIHAPRVRQNKPLNLHVGRESHHSRVESDDHTLGASTITTNFSTTQRTRGDNTVSTRSLFQSQKMTRADSLIIPQRRRGEDSDEEDSNNVDPIAQTSARNLARNSSGVMSSSSVEPGKCSSSHDKTFDRFGNETTRPNEKPQDRQTVLRRPPGNVDDLLDTIDSFDGHRSDSRLSTESQDGGRRRKDPPYFVQLAAETNGVQGMKVVRGLIPERDKAKSTTFMRESAEPRLSRSDGEMDDDVAIPQGQRSKIGDSFLRGSSDHIPRLAQKEGKGRRTKSRMGFFKRVKSWKGTVVLPDDDDERT